MNRAEKRRKAREYNTPHKLEMLAAELEKALRKEYEERANTRMEEFIRGYTTLIIYVLWHSFGFGKKRIRNLVDELEEHLDIISDVKRYELTLQDMEKMLREEAKVDIDFSTSAQKMDRKEK